MNKPLLLNVIDIRQYLYCPRKVYFSYVVPLEKKATFKMEYGRLMEEKIDRLETRRTLKRYKLAQGERHFHVHISSHRLGLSGEIDLLIKTRETIYPLDFKFVKGIPFKGHIYQLTGYALILEDIYKRQIDTGFIYLIPQDRIFRVEFTDDLKSNCLNFMEEIRDMILSEKMPPATRYRNRCLECECQKFCRDIW